MRGIAHAADPLDAPAIGHAWHPAVLVTGQRPGIAADHDTDIRLSNGLRIVASHDAFVLSTTDGRRLSFLDNVDIDDTHEFLDFTLDPA
ncbi:hypothetical protein ABIA39_003465 [Nocardia sp. GAS34]|uniref:hypothetical protein n=1 Tax=unclassified Nocardia TaxID=2637762 RepID=UPI003D1EE4D0